MGHREGDRKIGDRTFAPSLELTVAFLKKWLHMIPKNMEITNYSY
jgi:hypothetical protein